MADVTDLQTGISVRVRFFAAASAAAGIEEEVLSTAPGTTVGELIGVLRTRNDELARVLQRCSYLRDGIAVRDLSTPMMSGQTLDVLPPFAGG